MFPADADFEDLVRSTMSHRKILVGGRLVGDNYPSAEIVALVQNHMTVHRYSDVVPGFGIWSFVEKSAGKSMLLVFDHLSAYESEEDHKSVTLYWKDLSRISLHCVRVARYPLIMTQATMCETSDPKR